MPGQRTVASPAGGLPRGRRGKLEGVLLDYKARFYDSSIGRFIQPDSIIPNPADPQSWNRYSYVRNGPVVRNDPTGHWLETVLDVAFIGYDIYDINQNGLNWENGLSLAADLACAAIPVATGGGWAGLRWKGNEPVIDVDNIQGVSIDKLHLHP